MSKKLRIAIFKLIDILVIFTMVFASPMSITASAMAQDSGPALATDESDYAPGRSAAHDWFRICPRRVCAGSLRSRR